MKIISEKLKTASFKGIGISDGIASGELCFFSRNFHRLKGLISSDRNAEIEKWITAVSQACEQLCKLSDRARQAAGDGIASLFEAHVIMLGDIDFGDRVSELILTYNYTAEAAIIQTAKEFYRMFASLDDEYLSARCMDVVDIATRVINIIMGTPQDFSRYNHSMIVASSFLTPSEAAQLMFAGVAGFVIGRGDRYSHAAILAQTLGIPVVAGVATRRSAVCAGKNITINGSTGEISEINTGPTLPVDI